MSQTLESSPHSPRRILLIGPSGQVGWELRRTLQPLGQVIYAGRGVEAPGLGIDLANPDRIREVIKQTRPNWIVNAAAYTAVDKAEEERELATTINGVAPGIIAEEAKRIGAGVVHYSTDYVFDGSGEKPWGEDDATGPINHYGASKLAGEEAIRAIDGPHLIFRVSWVHGVHGANFVKTMLRLAAERTELSIVADQFGAPTSARVIADSTALVLSQIPRVSDLRDRSGTYHMVCAGETNWHEYAQEIFRQARECDLSLAIQSVKPIPTSAYPVPATRPLNSRMDCSKLQTVFGITPPTWEVALNNVLEDLIRQSPADHALFGKSPLLCRNCEGNAA